MGLSDLERRAGRVFRAACQAELDALNAAERPGGTVLPLWRWVRHDCPVLRSSAAIGLREHYQASPLYWVCYCSAIAPFAPYAFPHEDCQGGTEAAAEGLLAFIWKEGRCPDCKLVLRSSRGRLVLAAGRPPERQYLVAQ